MIIIAIIIVKININRIKMNNHLLIMLIFNSFFSHVFFLFLGRSSGPALVQIQAQRDAWNTRKKEKKQISQKKSNLSLFC